MSNGQSFFSPVAGAPKCLLCGESFLPGVYVNADSNTPEHFNCEAPFAPPPEPEVPEGEALEGVVAEGA